MTGELIVVTGAASGIGRATALRFAAAGARIAACDVDVEGLASLAAELGPQVALTERVDVGDRAQMKAFADRVHALGPVHAVINNAGVGLSGGILDTSLEDWDWVLRVNLGGVIHGCHFFAPPMVARGAGHIVNVSSVLGYYAAPGVLGYVTSKFGVLGLTLSLRAELAPHGVRVSAICPGLIATNIIAGTRFGASMAPAREKIGALFAKRGSSPDKVAAAIVNAVRRDRAITPVAPEAWALWALSRIAPAQAGGLGRAVSARFTGA
ncbi:MAG: SDR family NAD(P)-dependent oxidoreductase [Deltaproteobacteria bacterium]|nr:SDR family NAD(P)-dependent oxidoreductase [Deltaproteobacteria bacterium]